MGFELRHSFALLILIVQIACVSGRMANREPDRLFREGRYLECAEKLEEGLKDEGDGRDQLLYLMDLGLVYHTMGDFEKSNKYFLAADKIAEIKDYTSLATEAATLLTSDAIRQYKGEDFEKVLINTYLAMNFAIMGNIESALIEARKVNRKLYRMIHEGKRKYKQNAFAYYLSAVLYEAAREYDDAYIDYKKTHKLDPSFPLIGLDLWRAARLSGRTEDLGRWTREFGLTQSDHQKALSLGRGSRNGEIVVLYENGISPIKRPNPQFTSVPRFYARSNPVEFASVRINQKFKGRTLRLFDIESTAIQNLDDKYAGLIAKKLAGVVAKEVVGDQVAKHTKSEALGFLTKLFFYATDQADTRSWNMLPRDLQIARYIVPPGDYVVEVDLHGDSRKIAPKKVSVRSRQKRFVGFRYVP